MGGKKDNFVVKKMMATPVQLNVLLVTLTFVCIPRRTQYHAIVIVYSIHRKYSQFI